MRTENPSKRLARGEYFITPFNSPIISPKDKKRIWEVNGIRAWGVKSGRVRRSLPTWQAADELVQQMEEADREWLKTHEQMIIPAVIVSRRLSAIRLAEAERAVALLPRDANHEPDSRYRLDEMVAYGLQSGVDPITLTTPVKIVAMEVLAWIKGRPLLPWNHVDRMSEDSVRNEVRNLTHCCSLFGELSIAVCNSKAFQRTTIQSATQVSETHKTAALDGLRRILNYLHDRERIPFARSYVNNRRITRVPKGMVLLERQAYLDLFWDTDLAAAAIARFHMGLRPRSDLKTSQLQDAWGLTPDLLTYIVPIDSKTGHRNVEVPPVATCLFEILRKEGRLGELNEHGNYCLNISDHEVWSSWYLKAGYGIVTPARARKASSWLRSLPDDEAVSAFLFVYPRRLKAGGPGLSAKALIQKYIFDAPRKASISAWIYVSGFRMDSVTTYHGNTKRIIQQHYSVLMNRPEAFLHYQMIPTCLLATIDPRTIALPSWADPRLLSAQEKVQLEGLRAVLPQLASYRSLPTLAKERVAAYVLRGKA